MGIETGISSMEKQQVIFQQKPRETDNKAVSKLLTGRLPKSC
jgi:hypothetical protein